MVTVVEAGLLQIFLLASSSTASVTLTAHGVRLGQLWAKGLLWANGLLALTYHIAEAHGCSEGPCSHADAAAPPLNAG